MKGKLYLIPTTIADDAQSTIPDQVKELLTQVKYYLSENIRTSRRYISSLKLGVTIEELHFEVLDKKTSYGNLDKILIPLTQGHSMGILSESGCPGIADPGSLAVKWAHAKGMEVIPLVGPSSILLALMGSGFNGQKFCFHGYLPIEKAKLAKEITSLESESSRWNQTQIFIETPYRNNQLLEMLLKTCKPHSQLCIARDLTGKQQFLKAKTVKEWKTQPPDLNKVPTVFLLFAGKPD